MTTSLSVDSASHLLTTSNVIYVVGAVLTLSSAAMVMYEKNSKNKGIELRWGLTTEIVVIVAAFVSLIGTIGAIQFGRTVSHLKDVSLETYKTQAKIQIAQAEKDAETAKANAAAAIQGAGVANQNAEDARLKADKTETENSKLKVEVMNHETAEAKANAELAAQTEKVNRFAQGVAAQQQGMAQQMQAVPTLGEPQIAEIANQLKPFAGQKISVHIMLDAHSERLGEQIERALKMAGIVITMGSVDVGPNYQGVIVGVKNPSPAPHPEFANALLNAFHSVGILARGIAFPNLKDDEVGIYIGPN